MTKEVRTEVSCDRCGYDERVVRPDYASLPQGWWDVHVPKAPSGTPAKARPSRMMLCPGCTTDLLAWVKEGPEEDAQPQPDPEPEERYPFETPHDVVARETPPEDDPPPHTRSAPWQTPGQSGAGTGGERL